MNDIHTVRDQDTETIFSSCLTFDGLQSSTNNFLILSQDLSGVWKV